jgi:hypothetical protein
MTYVKTMNIPRPTQVLFLPSAVFYNQNIKLNFSYPGAIQILSTCGERTSKHAGRVGSQQF